VASGAVDNNQDANGRLQFGRMLASALKERRMKQEDLAQSLGTTQSSVSGWINGKYEPGAATVFHIERTLDLDPGSLSRPLGYLPVEPLARAISVEGAIAQSTLLDDDAKAALSALYRVLTKGSAGGRRSQPSSSKRERLANPDRPRSAAGGR
jgi:transcriptional regulator with XRE-family HTH domain